MKKISDSTLKAVNNISPDNLVAHGIIQPARVSGYICPECGSGSGSKGTGMTHNKKIESHTSFTCHSGRHSFNVLTLCSLHYGLNTRGNDYQNLVEKICADFGIEIEYDELAITSGKRAGKKKRSNRQEPLAPNELKNIQDDLNAPIEPLETFIQYQDDEKWRGFDFEFLKAHGCRLIGKWYPPDTRGTNKQPSTATWRMIIPAADDSYLARLVNPINAYDVKARPFIHEKQHAGRKKIFGVDNLNAVEPIFCFEGYFDAMSAELAGFNAVALGGCGEGYLLVDAIDKLTTKPQIIILFDPDNAGRKAAVELREDLLNIKCPCVVRFLSAEECKLDANDILQKQGVDTLRVMLQDILDNSLAELNAVEVELNKKDLAGLTDEDWDFIFAGNSTDLDYAGRLERYCNSNVRWLTDDERWLIYGNGFWRRGSDKNSCISPFVRRLADAMKQNANDKDERNLADKLRSSAKISASITLLKSFDSILITADDLDKHPQLLNAQNGVIDLETKKLFPAAPELLITQQLSVSYDDRADSQLIDKFFNDIMPDEETRAGLLRWLGYCLTGSVREEKFLVWLGDGGNGKGTLSKVYSCLLNDYASIMPTAALLKGRPLDADKATTALNGLAHARFAISEELPQGAMVDSSLIKNLTGGDLMTFRPLFCEYHKVTPSAKINLSGNFTPQLENFADKGLRRRMLVMPYIVTFDGDKRDPHLKEKLLMPDNLRGLLRLLVDNAADWYHDGLIISEQMKAATQEQLNANDFIADFLSEFCEVGEGKGEIPRAALLDNLKEKCAHARKFSDRDLCKLIQSKGINYEKTRRGRMFKGIRFLTDDDFVGEPINENDIPFDD